VTNPPLSLSLSVFIVPFSRHVIDFYLDPKSFPFDPPKAYFHSWTNGRGRVNPNLYEEGKVCLSILGTWAGEQSESWKYVSSFFPSLHLPAVQRSRQILQAEEAES
jgi:ubiquitin-protein ligase